MEKTIVAIKVDVDTYVGTQEGVPRLLEIFAEFGIRATFYFSLGPDHSGRAIRRIFTRKGFLQKMLRTKAPSTYGLKTLMYGTLLPGPMIGAGCGDVIRSVAAAGHETGIHCWDHVDWHDFLPRRSRAWTEGELGKAAAEYRRIFGCDATTTAAPGWTVSPASLAVQEGMGLSFCSDSRGRFPFYPVVEGVPYNTLQVPTTLPTMDEILGDNGIDAANVNDRYLDLIRPGLTVHTIHAEMEGMSLAPVFHDLLCRLADRGAAFITLGEAGEASRDCAPHCLMSMGNLPGRAGRVACQGDIA